MSSKVVLLAVVVGIATQVQADVRRKKVIGRIYGGSDVVGDDFPWMASIGQRAEFLCGGAILNKRTILTVGHCLYGRVAKRLLVRIGSRHVFKGGRVIPVSEFLYHPHYDNHTADYDIGLIRLSMAIQLSNYVQPVVLPSSGYIPPVGASAKISGWGETERGHPQLLQYAVMKIIDPKICRKLFKGEVYTDRMFCAGRLDAPINTCVGDSGSPLVIGKMVIGISSWASIDACKEVSEAGVYTRVPAFVNWIQNYVARFGERL